MSYLKKMEYEIVLNDSFWVIRNCPKCGRKTYEVLHGVWGQRHLHHLKQYRKVLCTNLLTSGKLNSYLVGIDERAEKRFELLTEQMKQAQDITEQLKAENALECAGLMNNIRACTMEIT